MPLFYLVRHGETAWNRHGNRYCGRTNIPLTETGEKQAAHLAATLEEIKFDRVIVSPFQRAQRTALPITKRFGLDMETDQRLSEIDFGEWEGLTRWEIEQKFPKQWKRWLQDPTRIKAGGCGESASDVFERMKSFFVEHSSGNHECMFVVSHNTAIRFFLAGTLGMPFLHYRKIAINNASVCVLDMKSATDIKWQVVNGCGSKL